MSEDLKKKKCQSEKLVMEDKNEAVATGSTGKKRKFESISDEFQNGTENVSLAISDTVSDSSDPNVREFKFRSRSNSFQLVEDEAGTETFVYNASGGERSPAIEVLEESYVEISPSSDDLGEVITPPIKPSEEELQVYFSAVEKQIREKQFQEKFAEKYNFDIVNDVPTEGRFDWVALSP